MSMNNNYDLPKNGRIMLNALTTLSEVLFSKDVTAANIAETIQNSLMIVDDETISILSNVYGYDKIILLKDQPDDTSFFTGVYQSGSTAGIIVDASMASKFIPSSTKLPELWQSLTYDLRDSVLLFECSKESMYYFHEVLPLAVAMTNGNKVYLVEAGTEGKLNDIATMSMYQNIARGIQNNYQPAYIKALLASMFREGNFGLVLGEEHCVVGCHVEETTMGSVKSIPARYLKYSISLVLTYATARFEFDVPMLSPMIQGAKINILDTDGVLSPLVLTSWVDEKIVNAMSNQQEITTTLEEDTLFSMLGKDIVTPALLKRLESIETINGVQVKDYTTVDKLDILRKEGISYYCHVLSKIWFNRTKLVYMQDVAIVLANQEYRIIVPMVEGSTMSHKCVANALIKDEVVQLPVNHSQAMCPLTQDYYMAGLSCLDSIINYREIIKQALYFRFTKYFPVDNLAVTSEDIRYFTNSTLKVPYINKLLNYNNVILGKRYNELDEKSMPLSAMRSSVTAFGEPNKRIDDMFQRIIKIPL